MRCARPRAIATILLAVAMMTVLWPAVASGSGQEDPMPFAQREEYVAGARLVPVGTQGVLTGGPLCDVPGTDLNLGGVCFGFDGRQHQVDFYVFDRGQNQIYKHGHTLNGPLSEAETTLEGGLDQRPDLGPLEAWVDAEVKVNAGAAAKSIIANMVRGSYRMLDADGNVLHQSRFCGGMHDLTVPARTVALEVKFDGALAGLPVDHRCPSAYAGATVGWAYLTLDD